jgi:cytochrome c oxidase subunit IV
MTTNYSKTSYKIGIISITLFVLLFIINAILYHNHYYSFTPYILLIFYALIALSLAGVVYAFMGLKEPNTPKKIMGFILNSVGILWFVFLMAANVFDIYSLITATS